MRQLLENECKIRMISLIKFSKCSLEEIQSFACPMSPEPLAQSAEALLSRIRPLLEHSVAQLDSDSVNVLYYISGALIRSEIRQSRRCPHCIENLVDDGDVETPLPAIRFAEDSESQEEISENVRGFCTAVNRGGLSHQSPTIFAIGTKCWVVFDTIRNTPELAALFFNSRGHEALYTKLILDLLEEDGLTGKDLVCFASHEFGRHLVIRFFHCFAKNFMEEVRSKAKQVAKDKAKLRKLSSGANIPSH